MRVSAVSGMDRSDRRLLEFLNAGGVPDGTVSKTRIDRLIERGLVAESGLGSVYITPRGQLELARWRFRNLPKPRYVVVDYGSPRPGLWQRIFR